MADIISSIGIIGSLTVTNATMPGGAGTEVEITCNKDHTLLTGEWIKTTSIGGVTGANGSFQITVTDTDKFLLDGSSGTGSYTSGGVIGRDYSDLSSFITATESLSGGNVQVGHVYPHKFNSIDYYYFAAFNNLLRPTGTSGTRSAAQHRELIASPLYRYDPATDTGVKIIREVGNAANTQGLIDCEDAYFEFGGGIGIFYVDSGGNANFPTDATFQNEGIIATSGGSFGNNNWFHDLFIYCPVGDVGSFGAGGEQWAAIDEGIGGNTFSNIIVVGKSGGGAFGLNTAFNRASVASTWHNCLIYGTRYQGVIGGTGGTVMKNCMALDCGGNGDFGTSFAGVGDYLISSDDTAAAAADTTYWINQVASQLFVNPDGFDFRNLNNSPAVDSGEDLSATYALDFYGNDRGEQWEIGPFAGVFVPTAFVPDVIISSIGTGKDYPTVADWETATRKHLIAANELHIGEVYGTASLGTTGVDITGAYTDAYRYRILRAARRYDAIEDRGGKITYSGGSIGAVRIGERYSQCVGIKVTNTNASTGNDNCCILVDADDVVVDSCFALLEFGSGTNWRAGVWVRSGDRVRCSNTIAQGSTTSPTAGIRFGIIYDVNTDHGIIANCIARSARQGVGVGFANAGGVNNSIWNSVAVLSDSCFSGFQIGDYNASSDTSAPSTHGIHSITAADEFNNPSGLDFRLKAGSQLINRGISLPYYNHDFNGDTRLTPWEIGVYQGYLTPPAYPRTHLRPRQTHYHVRCWKIERLDGVGFFFTESSHVLFVRGERYSPVGGFDGSASSSELGLREGGQGFSGIISSDEITIADLIGRKFDNAVVTEYLVDGRYPWLEPIREKVMPILTIGEYSAEMWKADLGSLASKLAIQIGENFSRNCEYDVFDPTTCMLSPVAHEELAKSPTLIVEPYLRFECNTLASSTSNNYNGGRVIWTSGDNVGIESEILDFKGSRQEILLALQTPKPIQTSDVFTIRPGCNGTETQCKAYGNYINYGGNPHLPGPKDALRTPTS